MTDPAEDAAQRVWKARYPNQDYTPSNNAVAAAREALAPVREWVERHQLGYYDVSKDGLAELAALLYSDAELNPEGTTP